MKRAVMTAMCAALIGVSACGDKDDEAPADATEAVAPSPGEPAAAPAPAEAPPTEDVAVATPDPVALPGAPGFAALYPGAVVQGELTEADAPAAGEGGIVTFTTADPAADVVAFYRGRAEASGLSSVMAMTQGETQAYGARSAQSGANLSVVASPLDGQTSVQLSWSAGG